MAAKISWLDARWLNHVGDLLTQVMSDAAASAEAQGISVTAVDPNSEFATHRLCDTSTSWLAGVSGNADYRTQKVQLDSGVFHPTVTGQKQGYEAAFLTTTIGQ